MMGGERKKERKGVRRETWKGRREKRRGRVERLAGRGEIRGKERVSGKKGEKREENVEKGGKGKSMKSRGRMK